MELSIEQALQRGIAAHAEGKLEEAERLYRTILQSQPLHPDANHNLGVLAVSLNKAGAALPLFKTALAVNPKIKQFWLSYIDALIKENQLNDAEQTIQQGKLQGVAGEILNSLEAQLASINETETVSNLSPSQARLNALLKQYNTGRFSDAESLALAITQEFPRHQFAWKVLGAVYEQASRNSEATNANQTLVTLSPEDAEAHSNLGNTLKKQGKLDEAEKSYKQAIALKPDYAEAHSNLGITLQELGRLDEAEASYTQAIALKPDYAEPHCNLGNTLYKLVRFDDAEASYTQAIVLNPDYAQAYYNLANMLYELVRFDDAEANYTKAITLNPDYAQAHNNLGNTLKDLGRLDEAENSYNQAIALKPDYSEAHNNLGSTLKDLGRFEEAQASYTQAIALKPDFSEAHYNLGVFLFEHRQYSLAAEEFEVANNKLSKPYMIQCSYLLEEEAIFYEKFDLLVNQGEINAIMGSLPFRSESKYGIKKSNPFCSDPLSYVVKTDLNAFYDFESIFVETARVVLSDNSISYRDQGHLTNGVQTAGNIFTQGKVPKTEIENIIHTEIEKYWLKFKGSEEGFIKNWPTSYEIKGWLVCMQSGGTLAPHMHAPGWITGSIYINVPPKSETNSGNLVLCLSDQENVPGVEKSQQSIIDVVTGSLCLFPSSLHHYTVPFQEKEERIVLAFDVIPIN